MLFYYYFFFFVLKEEKESAAHALFLLNSRWRCERSYPLRQVKDELSVVSALELQSLFVLCGDQSSSCKRSRPHVSLDYFTVSLVFDSRGVMVFHRTNIQLENN